MLRIIILSLIMKSKKTIYSYLWEFQTKKGCERRFEKNYGPTGEWVKLFRQARGYIRTELHRDIDNRGRYITIDYWSSNKAYDSFREQWKKEFNILDKRCESLMKNEISLGSFHHKDVLA